MTQNIVHNGIRLHRLRWQAFWGILAAIIPISAQLLFGSPIGSGRSDGVLINAFWGGVAAILLGISLIRNVGRYPGVEKASAIIPSFSVSFGILAVILLMLRLDYSRWILATTYITTVVIFYIGSARFFGRKHLVIGLLPAVDGPQSLPDISGIQWSILSDPDVVTGDLGAVAVDFRTDLPREWGQRLADFALAGLPVYHSKHLVESLTGRVELEHISETSFGTLSPPDAYMTLKHVVDRFAAAVALLILTPLFVVVAILIRLDSPGPAIFRQHRIGFRGKPFVVYKFRTMRVRKVDGKNSRDDAITRKNDNRITSLGKVLRRTRIDELPQIINVLLGQMSWIGPRPEAAVLSNWYETEIPFYRYRHIVRPGITGWAQVMQGHVAAVEEVRDKLYYDFYYIKNFSLWIDMLIVMRTLRTMISGFGAK